MKESMYKSYEELPLFLNADTVAKVLGVSPASAYELLHEKKFPALRIGNCIVVPNELFDLDLMPGEIALYACLMRLEDRKEYTCRVSYKKLGKFIGMSKKTVSKYVAMLEEKQLIHAEHTSVITKAGRKYNGCLLYKILPIQGAIDLYNGKQLAKLEQDTAREKAQRALEATPQPKSYPGTA